MKKFIEVNVTEPFLRYKPQANYVSLLQILACLVVFLTFFFYAYVSFKYQHVNQLSSVEDWAYTNIAARNFLQFGFLHSGLLQDYSPSTDVLDHPYVYDHMPPGPDILTAIFLKLFGFNYSLNRVIFAFFAIPGIYFFYKFTTVILKDLGEEKAKAYASIAILLIGPLVFLNHMQKEVHSLYLLLTFSALYLTHLGNLDGKKLNFRIAVVLTFLLSIYIQYILLAATIFIWVYLYVFELYDIKKRQLMVILATITLGVLIHLLQNFIFFGPEIFSKELLYSLGNRIFGYPTQESLKYFYESHAIVHHGASKVSAYLVIKTILKNIYFNHFVAIATVSFITAYGLRLFYSSSCTQSDKSSILEFKNQFNLIVRLFIFSFAVVFCVIFIFPAHTQEVNLSTYGQINLMLFSIPCVATVGLLVNLFVGISNKQIKEHLKVNSVVFLLLAIIGLVFLSGEVLFKNANDFRQLGTKILAGNKFEDLEKLSRFRDRFYMSNVNVPVVGFFTESPGFGVCGRDSVGQTGKIDLNGCKLSELKRSNYWKEKNPEIFIFVKDAELFSGFATCWPRGILLGRLRDGDGCNDELGVRLINNYKLLESNTLFEVYDLREGR